MKRLLQILGLLIVLLLATLIILPIVFKDEIVDRTKLEINKNLNATVEFDDISLSLFRSFPNFSLGISKFTVDGIEEFKDTRLADIGEFNVELNLMSVIFGDQFEIESIALNDASIHVVVLEDGKANYDITKSSETPVEEEAPVNENAEPGSFKLALKHYEIQNFNLDYTDKQGGISAIITDLDHEGNGDFTQDIVNLKTKTSIEGITVESEGVRYLSKVKTESIFDIEFDQPEFKITFGENELSLNDLKLEFTGFVALPDDDITMDVSFLAPNNSFKSVLSLIPAIFYKDFEDIKTNGQFDLKGKVAGVFNGEKEVYPSFDVLFNIDQASFQYPDLPASVAGIKVNTHIYNKSNQLDATVVDLSSAQAEIAGSKLKASMLLKTPISDPNISAQINTNFDLENLAKAIPMEGYDYSGNINAQLNIAALMSDVDKEDYDKVKAAGSVKLNALSLAGDSVPVMVTIPSATALFSPQYVDLQELTMNIGKSDIAAKGKIDNMLGYVLKDEVLKAQFEVNSKLMDLNDLTASMASEENTASETESAQKEESTSGSSSDTAAMSAVRIPENIDFELVSNIDRVLFSDLVINDLKGIIFLKEGEARMDKVSMNTLGGELSLNGGYNSKPDKPEVDMDMTIKDFGFKESFDAFEIIRELVPIMGKTDGNYSTSFTLASALNEDMSPDLNSVLAAGNLFTKGMSTSPNSLQKLSSILKNPDYATLDIGKVDLKFKIENGKLEVEPFDIKAGNVSAKVYGSQSLDQTMDYTMDMKIPASGLQTSGLLKGIGNSSGKIDLGVKIGGTPANPKISTSLGDLLKNVVDDIKQQVQEKVEEVKQEVKDKVNEEAKKLVEQASAKGDQLIAEAEKQAQSIKDAAKQQADKLRSEGETQAKKVEEEAKGNFLKEAAAKEAAKRIRDTAYEKATKLEEEAAKKADALVQKAKDEKQRLIKEAEEKAKV